MLFKLLALFIGIPVLEMVLLVGLGDLIGFWATIGLVVGTGILGAALARAQGFRVWLDIQRELRDGRMPMGDLANGLLVLIGGIVLLTPGLLTDLLGIALLIPATRTIFKKWLHRKFERMIRSGRVSVFRLID